MREELLRMAPSLTEAVYLKLRGELLNCVIAPGAKLKIGEIAARMGVNLSPVREALSRLAAEGLATAESQKGFRAAPVSVSDLQDLTAARIEIEVLCLKSSIEAGDVEWETGIVASFHRLIRTPEFEGDGKKRTVSDTWASAHADFHYALVSACANVWLLRMREMLYNQSERYRRLSIPLRVKAQSNGRPSQQEKDHRKLMDAALSRNALRATRTIAEHLNKTAELVKVIAARSENEERSARAAFSGRRIRREELEHED